MISGLSKSPYLKVSFDLFEEFEAAADSWDLKFRQLGPAARPYLLEQVATDRLIYNRSVFFSRFHQMGGSPAGCRTFTFLASGSREFRWCGELVTSDVLVVMPDSGEFESMSPPGLDCFHVSLDKQLLEEVAEEDFDCELQQVLGPERTFCQHGGEYLRQLRHLLHSLSRTVPAGAGTGVDAPQAFSERYIAYLLLNALRQGVSQPRGPRNRRMRALYRAIDVLQETDNRISVPELADSTGVSRRTLEGAFQDMLSVSPASYIKAHRLQRLRGELLTAHSGDSSVTQLARRHGFTHGGQLALDYSKLFGELPGATLRR